MASHNIRSSIIVPERTRVVSLEIEVYGLTPTAFVPDVLRSEDYLQ